ncbi:hypothetical protein M8C17_01420 [Micromonospora sp. RHAY321]|uniref:hypothetical protein n=1 Tax=Micromonospora sp. RHAY321 TaxID=2944807 RepID=UPI00207C2A7B|nr:hypothetical protein [Micromonospora sp. RHAY321]MCO1593820.1 hypothetical protein [Micromonospora sp. RHAY321]
MSGGTGLILVGQTIGGTWGAVITYLSPAMGYLIGYGLMRWNAWADRRQRQRAMVEFEKDVNDALASPALSEGQKQGLLDGLAQIKVAAAMASLERVRLSIQASAPERLDPGHLASAADEPIASDGWQDTPQGRPSPVLPNQPHGADGG